MTVIGQIKKGAYFDSVTLMTVGREVTAMDGVTDAAVVMGTAENKAILAASGLLTPELESAGDTDLLIAFSIEDAALADSVTAAIEAGLARTRVQSGEAAAFRPKSLSSAVEVLPGANMAIISVAGRYAGDLALEALDHNLHVMLFSDNVSVEQEVAMKKHARDKGLLVMGPDCGTAIINGVPLAFANVVPRGNIGIVAASGTGLQEVSCLLAHEGCGVSQAIGTGGRDVKEAVGGIMFIEGFKALVADDATQVILLVAKPPHPDVLAEVRRIASGINKPVVSILLGAQPEGELDAATLEEAALKAAALSRGGSVADAAERIKTRQAEIATLADREVGKRNSGQRYVRGLFSGGTFCTEAQLIFSGKVGALYANAPGGSAKLLDDVLISRTNTVVDLGADEFTVGRPHPMIDFSLRNKRILTEADDAETAVILLDVVLGYGANLDPAGELVPVLEKVSDRVSVVCSVTGTDQDPQHRARVCRALEDAGAIVMSSNAAACDLACAIIQKLGGDV